MNERPPLTRIVAWAQQLAGEALRPGDLTVDLTAGSGRDTLALWRRVGPTGRVLAFDVQPEALDRAAALLAEAGAPVFRPAIDQPADRSRPGIHLLCDCHARLDSYLSAAPRAVLANLGYLPGGDPARTTLPATTRAALDQARDRLAPGGRLVAAVYRGHPGAAAEAAAVEELFAALAPAHWQVLRLEVANRPLSPFLLAAERIS